MDTFIFVVLFAAFVAMWRGKRSAAGLLLLLAFLATALLFKHHATDSLAISL